MRVRAALGAGALALVGTAVLGLSSAASAASQAIPMQLPTTPTITSNKLGKVQFLHSTAYKATPAKALAKLGAKEAAGLAKLRQMTDRPIPKAAGKAAPNLPSAPAT